MPTGSLDSQEVKNVETVSDSMCFIVLHLSSLELSHNQICAANPLQEHQCSLQDLFFLVSLQFKDILHTNRRACLLIHIPHVHHNILCGVLGLKIPIKFLLH